MQKILLAGCVALALLSCGRRTNPDAGADHYDTRGVVRGFSPDRSTIEIQHENIPEFMGARGSDAALEQADIVLMHDRIENVEEAVVLSRRARSIIRQNVVISLGVILFLILSALAEKINLTTGVIGHEGSTVVVILNGLRLLRSHRN